MNELNGMTCAELADVAAELALGVLTGRERAVAIGHLNGCEACREDVRQLMATGEQLRELLPPAEPPAGFESRVLERLGLPASAGQNGKNGQDGQTRQNDRTGQDDQAGWNRQGSRDGRAGQDERGEQGGKDARPPRAPGPKDGPRHRRAGGDTARPGARQPGAPPAGPGAAGRPGRMRRVLAATAALLAVIAAGLGGWRIGVGSAPASPLMSASLVSGTSQDVGKVFYYSRDPGWLYMSVDMGLGDGMVTCQVTDSHGRFTTVGSFRLADGYGAWGSPDPGELGTLTAARLVSANGTVLATGTFTST
jgi:hypothetical protein